MPGYSIAPINIIGIDDTVISGNGQVGVVERLYDTGQVLVSLLRNGEKSGVYCTYDNINLLTKVNRGD
jgi:hypothetical protein